MSYVHSEEDLPEVMLKATATKPNVLAKRLRGVRGVVAWPGRQNRVAAMLEKGGGRSLIGEKPVGAHRGASPFPIA